MWGERTLPGAIDSEQALHEVAALHVTHVLDVQSPVPIFRVHDHPKNLQLVFESANQWIYRVIAVPQ